MLQFRAVIGAAGLLAFVYVAVDTHLTLTTALSSGREISAIQIIQVYSGGIFYGTVALGLVLSAYVLTRIVN
jgi:hypothetical protein